ncbi:hypothetical protein OS122_05740 [Mycolicibacterium mucogenicum]|uniref:hypothetical protein n=1 Tax=Mycolicibacterium mucogenicum TaxID=56689 RepID=UPI002269F3FC|nr:hypothetical protein [Mycolicibacterium mucogenicum]MCX8560396.1 hypothetical protein [Mycolicibacterium mucogenicum]
MVSETTSFDKPMELIPLLDAVVPRNLVQLHQVAGLSAFPAPLIGSATQYQSFISVGAFQASNVGILLLTAATGVVTQEGPTTSGVLR